MKEVLDESVDMILTDPPYGITDCKWDKILPLPPWWGADKPSNKAERSRAHVRESAVYNGPHIVVDCEIPLSVVLDEEQRHEFRERKADAASQNRGDTRFQQAAVRVLSAGAYREPEGKGYNESKIVAYYSIITAIFGAVSICIM